MEILSRKLNLAAKCGIMPFWSSIKALEINHILYADDILIFSNGGKSSFRNLLRVLDNFCVNSRQVLQPAKCRLFFSKHIETARRNGLLRMSGYTAGSFPIRYLGAPLFSKAPRIRYFQGLVDAIKERIQGWTKSFLSMAGRLTMIQSVLTSIPIHTLSALHVPKGTLDAIERLIRSYLWSGGDQGRRHWVSWDTVCSDVASGGLGIRPLHVMMAALRGKLAWNYLCNDSLWSKHARSRFKIGGRGSHLWKNISPFITAIALDCHWRIGDGSTLTGLFCHNLGLACPRKLQNKPIREVLANLNLRRDLIHGVNPRIFQSIDCDRDIGVSDKLVWGKDPSGVVSTHALLHILAPSAVPDRIFGSIWNKWLPPKISCFLWKILHRALPTNDNVMRVGISLVSKCYCCVVPGCESMDHLFISGQMADVLWCFICPLFRKQRPVSLRAFFHDWGEGGKFKRFANFLGFGLVCLCFWEIWKIRCSILFDERPVAFTKFTILRCASVLSKVAPSGCLHDVQSRSICNALRILAPQISLFTVFWSPWIPVLNGISCNVAVNISDTSSSFAAILRGSNGSFIYALKLSSTCKYFLKCLFHLLNELARIGLRFDRLQTSHEDIGMLGGKSLIDRSLYPIKRRLAAVLHGLDVFRVSFSLNLPAESLCFSGGASSGFSSFESLPSGVQRALLEDNLLHPCSFMDQRIHL